MRISLDQIIQERIPLKNPFSLLRTRVLEMIKSVHKTTLEQGNREEIMKLMGFYEKIIRISDPTKYSTSIDKMKAKKVSELYAALYYVTAYFLIRMEQPDFNQERQRTIEDAQVRIETVV